MNRTLKASQLALAAIAGLGCLFISDTVSLTKQFSLIMQADARVGRPLTPRSAAGVARRTERRAVRRGAFVGAGAYYGAGGYYGDYDSPYGAYAYGDPGGGYGAMGATPAPAEPIFGAAPAPAGPTSTVGPGADYGPGPVPSSVIVNSTTGRWCTFEQSGWHWCWTP